MIKKLFFISWSIFFCLSCFACQHAQVKSSPYPSHWWKPVPREGAPSWEILPQEASSEEVILSKRNELGILSNFAATPFTYRGKTYASVEGFWQMMKYPESANDFRAQDSKVTWLYTREQVGQMTSFEAKKAGTLASNNMKILGIDWVTFEGNRLIYREQAKGDFYKLIYEAEWNKLQQNPEVRKILLSTGNLKLRPDHQEEPDAAPAWRYYEIWMDIRQKISKN